MLVAQIPGTTGLAAVVVAGLFALSFFFLPLLAPLQNLHFAYAPALMAVGLFMLQDSVGKFDFRDLTESPSVLPHEHSHKPLSKGNSHVVSKQFSAILVDP